MIRGFFRWYVKGEERKSAEHRAQGAEHSNYWIKRLSPT